MVRVPEHPSRPRPRSVVTSEGFASARAFLVDFFLTGISPVDEPITSPDERFRSFLFAEAVDAMHCSSDRRRDPIAESTLQKPYFATAGGPDESCAVTCSLSLEFGESYCLT